MEAQQADGDPALFLRLPNDLSAVATSREAVAGFLAPFGVDRLLNRVEVVLEELVSNLVRHGEDVSEITVAADYDGDSVDLVIEDDGIPFDPFAMDDPAPFTHLDEASLGGLGIHLVRRLSKAARYDRVGARNRVSVTITA